MSRPTSELAHLFRALKAPAAARALPKLADRARADEWSFEQFAAALLKTEIDSRDSHGGQARIKAARFPGVATSTARNPTISICRHPQNRGCSKMSRKCATGPVRLFVAVGPADSPDSEGPQEPVCRRRRRFHADKEQSPRRFSCWVCAGAQRTLRPLPVARDPLRVLAPQLHAP